jgi:thioredoxin 1
MIDLVNDTTFANVINQGDAVLVDFSAKWCGPCKMQKPVLSAFAEKHPEIRVVEVDVDDSPRTAGHLGIQAMPTLVLFRGGQPVARARGLQNAAKLEALVAS